MGLAAVVDVLRAGDRVVQLLLLDPVERHDLQIDVDDVEGAVDAEPLLLRVAVELDALVRVVGRDQHLQVEDAVRELVAGDLGPQVKQERVVHEDRARLDQALDAGPLGLDRRLVIRVVRVEPLAGDEVGDLPIDEDGCVGVVGDDAERLLLVADVPVDDLVVQPARVAGVRVEAGDRPDDVRRWVEAGAVELPLLVELDDREAAVRGDRRDLLAAGVGDAEADAADLAVRQHGDEIAGRGPLGVGRQRILVALRRAVRLGQQHAVEAEVGVGVETGQVDPQAHDAGIDRGDEEIAVGVGRGEAVLGAGVEDEVLVLVDEDVCALDRHVGPGVEDAVLVEVVVDEAGNRPGVDRGTREHHARLERVGEHGAEVGGRPRLVARPADPARLREPRQAERPGLRRSVAKRGRDHAGARGRRGGCGVTSGGECGPSASHDGSAFVGILRSGARRVRFVGRRRGVGRVSCAAAGVDRSRATAAAIAR